MTPAKAKQRRKLYKRAHNIVHNNIPANMRQHFLPITQDMARRTNGNYVPFADKLKRKIQDVYSQRNEAKRKQSLWYNRAKNRIKDLFSGNPRLFRRLNP